MGAVLFAAQADATYHTFIIDEIFSTADGTVQYVVLRESQGANGEHLLGGRQLVATRGNVVKTFTFPSDLPSATTANRRVLIGTTGYAALGLVAPDYTIPDRFLPTDGGTLNYAGADILPFPALPTDGTNAYYRAGNVAANFATNFAGATSTVSYAPVGVVEFYNAALDHYFVSPLAPDIDALDAGRIAGWARTGQAFKAHPAAGAGLNPVCRYYIPPQHGNSHFLSASPIECATILGKIPTDPNYSGYVYETPSAFHIALPDIATGACPAGTQPVYRLWNRRADSNHRYTTNATIKAQMLAQGYVAEGYGADAVGMCAPATILLEGAVRVSGGASPFPFSCDGAVPTGLNYAGAEVEPFVAVDPRDANHLIGVWQQDRWSDGGAAGIGTGVSFDGGRTWTRAQAPFSRCSGGTAANGGDYSRVSDPWVTIALDGSAYQVGLQLDGGVLANGSRNAIAVSRSADGGRSWSNPLPLIQDGATAFNDKQSITADSTNAQFVYATWDRLVDGGGGPAWFARTANSGQSWEAARPIYDPGKTSQTLNNQIAVLADGTLVLLFTRLDSSGNGALAPRLMVLRSADKGATWSAPIEIGIVQSVGTRDPEAGTSVRDGSLLGSISAGKNGTLAVAWQDSRFSGGVRDAIAFSRSVNGGLTWSAPVRVNAVPTAAAFVPAVAIRDDGTFGVSYYDFRNNSPSFSILATDFWLAQSTDGVIWTERHVAGPFDLQLAPNARGLFLGDYNGLVAAGTAFLPLFAATNPVAGTNRTDIFVGLPPEAAATARSYVAETAPELPLTPELQQRISDNAVRAVQARRPGWRLPPAP